MDIEQHDDMNKGFNELIKMTSSIQDDVHFLANTVKALLILWFASIVFTILVFGGSLRAILTRLQLVFWVSDTQLTSTYLGAIYNSEYGVSR